MNTKGIKFLAVLAVLAMAFAVIAVSSDSDAVEDDYSDYVPIDYDDFVKGKLTLTADSKITETIKLTEGNYTLDLNGYELVTDEGVVDAFWIVDDNTSLKIIANNGSIKAGDSVVYNAKTQNSSIEINGGTYSGGYVFCDYADPAQTKASGSFKISNATIDASVAGIWFGNGKTATISVDNTKIVSGDVGIYLGSIGTAKLSNVDVKSVGTSLEIKSGTVTVSGGSYASQTYVASDAEMNNNGSGNGEDTICINNAYAKLNASAPVKVVFQNDVKITNAKVGTAVQVVAGHNSSKVVATETITVSGLEASILDIVDTDFADDAKITIQTAAGTLVVADDVTSPITKDTYYVVPEDGAIDGITVNGASLTVKAEAAVSGTITIDGQAIKLTDFKGIATFSKGSIIIQSGTMSGNIDLADDDVLKLSGTIAGDFSITKTTGSKTATVLFEEGTTFATGENTLTIDGKIIVDVYGEVSGKMVFDKVQEFNIYSGSDVNYLDADYELAKGFDGNGGTWSYDGSTITFNAYKGTYNFLQIYDSDVVITGDVVVSYAPVEYIDVYFMGDIATVQDAGTFTLNIDLTNAETPVVPEADDGQDAPVVEGPVAYIVADDISKVGITVDVSGTPDWTDAELKSVRIVGLYAGTLYNSPFTVDVLFDEDIGYGAGAIVGSMTNCGAVSAKASYVGIVISGSAKDTQVSAEAGSVAVMLMDDFSSNATVTTPGMVWVQGEIQLSQGAVIDCADLYLSGSIKNNGTIKTSGQSLILPRAGIENYAVFENSGTMGVYGSIENLAGAIDNTAGTINNSGEIYFHAYAPSSEFTITIASEEQPAEGEALLSDVRFTIPEMRQIITQEGNFDYDAYTALINGVFPVSAVITPLFEMPDYNYDETEFTGTFTVNEALYVLEITDGTASISISCDRVTEEYVIEVSGTIEVYTEAGSPDEGEAQTDYETLELVNYTEDFTVREIDVSASECNFYVQAGKVTSTGEFVYEFISASKRPIVDSGATFEGDLTIVAAPSENPMEPSNAAVFLGQMRGDIISNGDVAVLDIVGDITASTVLVGSMDDEDVAATMEGNIAANVVFVMPDSTMNGSIIAQNILVLLGTVTGDIACECKPLTIGDEETPGAIAVADFNGNITITNGDSYFIALGDVVASVTYTSEYVATAPAEGEEAVKTPFTVTFDVNTVVDDDAKAAATGDIGEFGALIIKMVAGTDADAEEGTPGYIEYASEYDDTTFDSFDGTASVTVNSGKFMVADDVALVPGYELVIEAGATLEVDIAYDFDVTHGALKVSKDAVRNYEVNVVGAPEAFGEVLYIMSFDIAAGYTIYSDIAYAVSNCDPNSELTVGQSAAVESDISVKEGVTIIVGEDITLTINGDITTEMADGAKFLLVGTGNIAIAVTEGTNTVSGTFEYDGNVIEFENAVFNEPATIVGVEPFLEGDVPTMDVKVDYNGKMTVLSGMVVGVITIGDSGELVVAEGATIYGANITDTYLAAADDAEASASVITVNGTIYTESLEITGTINGSGQVVLAENGTVTINETAAADIKIVDENENGYVLAGVTESYISVMTSTDDAAEPIVVIAGNLVAGQIDAVAVAYLGGIYIFEDATIVADEAVVLEESTAYGKLKAKTLEDDTLLVYDATYADGEYTVYTHFLNIDQTAVTDITVKGEALSDNIAEDPAEVFAVAGINLTIAEDTTLTIDKPMIIGTPRTSLGAGTVITGTIVIDNSADANVYIIVYTDADVSAAEILGADEKAAAKSAFDIDGTAYADVYANSDLMLKVPADAMKPEIKGYVFTFWSAYNGADLASAAVGTTDVTSTLVAGKVTITLKDVPGVAYYINNVEQATEVAIKIDVESIITMKITDTEKYEGTPKINGQVSYKVTGDDDGATLEATGVTEKKAPSNDDDDDDGLGLTEILLIVLVVLIAVMCVILILRLNRS